MASHTLTLNSAPAIGYPEGQSVAIYPVSGWPTPEAQRDPSGATPVGSATATASVSSGNIAFGSVADGDYWAYASVGGNKVYRLVHVGGPDPSGDIAHLSPDQTFAGVETFTQSPVVPAPSSGTDAANKTYADLKLAKASNLSDVANAATARTNLAVASAAELLAIPRRKITGQILLSSAATTATNYFAATYASAVNPSGTAVSAFPGSAIADWDLDATLYPAIAGLNPLLRLKAVTKVAGTNPNYTITVGLYPITEVGGVLTPGTLVPGSSTSHVINANNSIIRTTTSGIALPASGLYTPVATINQAPTTATVPTAFFVDVYYG